MKTLIKEIFIMCLLCIVIILILGILFYEYTPTKKALPDMISYSPDGQIADQIEEIDLSTKNTAIIKSYSLGSSDLSMYKSQNLYVSGKKDPFAKYTEEETNTNSSITQTNSSDNVYSSNNNNNNSNNSNNNSNNNNTTTNNNSSDNNSNSNTNKNTTSNTSSTGSFFEKPGVK